jgi:Variant SH3 domain
LAAGKSAATPAPEKHKPALRAIALFTFKGVEDADLAFNKGDILELIHAPKTSEGWWRAKLDGKAGMIPSTYVKLLKEGEEKGNTQRDGGVLEGTKLEDNLGVGSGKSTEKVGFRGAAKRFAQRLRE